MTLQWWHTSPRPNFKHWLWRTKTGHWLFKQLPVNRSLINILNSELVYKFMIILIGLFSVFLSCNSLCQLCEECTQSACAQVMFFFNDECLLIACNRSWPTACDAVPNKNKKFADAYYLRVRTTGELTSWFYWFCWKDVVILLTNMPYLPFFAQKMKI